MPVLEKHSIFDMLKKDLKKFFIPLNFIYRTSFVPLKCSGVAFSSTPE